MKNILLAASLLFSVLAAAGPAAAEPVQIFADQTFQHALQEISTVFTEQTRFAIQLHVGLSAVMAESIHLGLPADIFFPATEEQMRHMVERGLVDVALKRNIVVRPTPPGEQKDATTDVEYAAAAVLVHAANRLGAMAFLEFLVADEARAIFARHGYSLP